MTTTTEARIIPLIPADMYSAPVMAVSPAEALLTPEEQEQQRLADETWRRSIPAQVFLNYFFALSYHIQEGESPPSTPCAPPPSWATRTSCVMPCTGPSRRPTIPFFRACKPSSILPACARTTPKSFAARWAAWW